MSMHLLSSLIDFESTESVSERLFKIHQVLKERMPSVCRIAVALYDEQTDLLKTFVHSTDGDNPLPLYQCKLSDAKALQEIHRTGKARIVNRLRDLPPDSQHTEAIQKAGFDSSFTQALYNRQKFIGFIFFNSQSESGFKEEQLADLNIFAYLVNILITNEFNTLTTLGGIVQSLEDVTQFRDQETGCHLERMSRYSRIIARALAPKYELNDEYVEYLFLFSTLHDIGKITIPDSILLKQGPLDGDELEVMHEHSAKGKEIMAQILNNLSLESLPYTEMLFNIILHHHESWDGSGYPGHLAGSDIPIEARIVSVADVFDALTSVRPYKKAWTVEETISFLQEKAGVSFDPDCVQALVDNLEECCTVMEQFQETA